jgi:hypothetical protein
MSISENIYMMKVYIYKNKVTNSKISKEIALLHNKISNISKIIFENPEINNIFIHISDIRDKNVVIKNSSPEKKVTRTSSCNFFTF